MGSETSPASPEQLLRGTPYLIGDGPAAEARFATVANKACAIQARAIAAASSISEQAEKVLPQFEIAIRSDLVAESNRLEGIRSSAREIRDLARAKADLLRSDVGSFLATIREDRRLLDSLGLYRAYAVADDWAASHQRPREFELRGLHALVMPGLRSAGQYKQRLNRIDGSDHVPVHPMVVKQQMAELACWFETGSGDAALDAAGVHAWVTHIHPFDDGNGRMARLLANLALIQARYPPLLLRSGADRGQYLDSLAASDEGDILPLYDLLIASLRRVVKTMEHPNYVQAKIRQELLASSEQRYTAWLKQLRAFFVCLEQKSRGTGWAIRDMGYPTAEHFGLLEGLNHEGNCWFAKFRRSGVDEWLLWFGFHTRELRDLIGDRRCWPSMFFAQRTEDPAAVHPFVWRPEGDGRRPAEISLVPGNSKPAMVRTDFDVSEMHIDEAAAVVVKALCR